MQAVDPREQDAERLGALRALDVLDSAPEGEFDALVGAAALACDAPLALVSLVDEHRVWFKANWGLTEVASVPRASAFCDRAVLGDDILEVPDACVDCRFADHPLVVSGPKVRFYAGMPVRLSGGARVGTLCVMGPQPRELSQVHRDVLRHLALATARALEGRQAARQLATEDAQQRRQYEATPAMLHSIDAEGRLIAVSDLWLSKLGYTRDEVLGRPSTEFLSPASQVLARTVVLPAFFANGHCEAVEYQMVTRQGGLMDVMLSATLEHDASGAVVRSVAVIEDVTLRRQAQRRLDDEQRRLDNIIDGTDVGTWEWNVATGELRLNDRFADIVGQPLAAWPSTPHMPLAAHMHPDDLPQCERLLQRHFEGKTVRYECEVRVRHSSGHWVWLKDRGRVTSWTANGQPEWMFGTRRDISERKRQEVELVRSQQQLKAVTDNMPALISYIDRDHRFRFANLAYQTWLDLSPASLIGRHIRDLYGDEVYAKILPHLDRALAGEAHSYERTLDTPHGMRHLHATMTPHRSDAGDIVGLYVLMNDITALKRVETQLAVSQERLSLAVDGSHLALFDWNLGTNQVYHSAHWSQMQGGEAVETTTSLPELSALVHPQDLPGVLLKVAEVVKGITPFYSAEHRVRTHSGTWLWILSRGRVVERDARGRALRLSGTNADISEQKSLEAQLQHLAEIDHLTNLPNRLLFNDRLQSALHRVQRHGTHMALLLLDVDHFKAINDGHGHDAGDAVLQEVALRLTSVIRKTDTVARLGGDEFAILLADLHASDEAEKVAGKVVDVVAQDFAFAGETLRFTASVGLAFLDHPNEWKAALIKRADQALYGAKFAGRNRYHCAAPGISTHAWSDTSA